MVLGRALFRYEAIDLRDGDKAVYLGNGVTKAVMNVNEKIAEALVGMDPTLQSQIDQAMTDLDKSEKKVILISMILHECMNSELFSREKLVVFRCHTNYQLCS